MKKHGKLPARLYGIWCDMHKRCFNPNAKNYKWYGGKGIGICDKWIKDYCSFRDWSIDNGYKEDLTIDRINSEMDYSPDNCRWISRQENARIAANKRWEHPELQHTSFQTEEGRKKAIAGKLKKSGGVFKKEIKNKERIKRIVEYEKLHNEASRPFTSIERAREVCRSFGFSAARVTFICDVCGIERTTFGNAFRKNKRHDLICINCRTSARNKGVII
jgi:hypothetical protein